MWVILAFLSAISAGSVSVTVKAGFKNVDCNVATFLRTAVVLFFCFIMVLITNTMFEIQNISFKEWAFIISSGLCTGFSWICFFKALKVGDVNKVVPVDKLSTVLTILLAIVFLQESFWWLTFVAMVVMTSGTFLMINKAKTVRPKENNESVSKLSWFPLALLSLIFASLTSILAKVGMQNMSSTLGTFLRTIIVTIMSFLIVLGQKKITQIPTIKNKDWILILVSGILTGVSWLCYYAAIQLGNVSIVVPIDKLSVLVSVILSYFIYKEKLNIKSFIGLVLLLAGTLLLLI